MMGKEEKKEEARSPQKRGIFAVWAVDEEELKEIKWHEVGIYRVMWFGKSEHAYIHLSKKILDKWEELGYNTRNLYVFISMCDSGVLRIFPLSMSGLIEAQSRGYRAKPPLRKESGQDNQKKGGR